MLEVLPQNARGEPLAFLDNIRRAVGGPYADKQVDVVGLDGEAKNLPALLSAFLPDEGVALAAHGVDEHGLAALGAPDEVVDNEVDAVLVALVFERHSVEGDAPPLCERAALF